MARRGEIERLQSELEELLEDLWRGPRFARHRSGFRPHVDLVVSGDPPQLTIVVELAGVDPEHIHVVVVGSTLVVSGRRGHLVAEHGCDVSWHQAEIPRGPFERRLRLPASADAAAARATYARGMLTVVLPLAPAEAPEGPVAIPVALQR